MKWLLLGLMIAFFAIPAALAVTPRTVCQNGIFSELYYNQSGLTYNNTYPCTSGTCAYNGLECDTPAPPEAFFAFAVVFSLSAGIFAYLAIRLGENESFPILRFMFLGFAVTYIAYDVYIASGFATLTLNSLNDVMVGGYILGVFTILAIVFYFVLLGVKGLLEMLLRRRMAGRPVKW